MDKIISASGRNQTLIASIAAQSFTTELPGLLESQSFCDVLASVLIIYNAVCSVHVFGLNNIFICTIRSMLNSIYTMKYMSGFEHKHKSNINHLLQIMSSYE